MNVSGKTWLVTGGASGLGAACVRRFTAAGGNVVIADRNEAAGRELARELGDRTRFVACDVTVEAQAAAAVQTAVATFGGLHGAINCAGVAVVEKVLAKDGTPSPLESFVRAVHINLVGTYTVARLAAAAMLQQAADETGARGVIINTASIAAFDGQIGQTAYAASKGGIAALTLPMAREFAAYGIRVATIAPGIFETPMLAGLPEKARQSLAEQVPFPKRLGRPSEYAALAQHIVENDMINGEVIRLDGALRMGPR